MKRTLIAATALALLSGMAFAQNSGSNSASTATNTSGSQSSSVASPTVKVNSGNASSTSGAKAVASTRSSSRSAAVGNTTNITVSGSDPATDPASSSAAAASSGSGSGEQYVEYGGSYTVKNTPEVIPPSVVGGNACAVGASGGLALSGFGIAAGGTWADKACERRQQAALLFNMGEQKVALELMCQDDHVRDAMKLAGKPCSADVPVAAAPAPPAAINTAGPIAPVPERHVRPEWCYTASPAELRGHAECALGS